MSERRVLPPRLSDFLVETLRATEATIRVVDSTFQNLVANIDAPNTHDDEPRESVDTSSESSPGSAPPRSTPSGAAVDLESTVASWANGAVRRLRNPHLGRPGPRGLAADLFASLPRASEIETPWWTLPLALPLAATRLGTAFLLRAEAVAESVEPAQMPDFLDFVTKTWSDLPVYFTLQYGQALEHLRERLEDRPKDPELRFAFAETLLECGLFLEAAEHFEELSSLGARRAHHWAMVSYFRAGLPSPAVDHGLASLERGELAAGRLWLHLAAEMTGRQNDIPQTNRLKVFSARTETDIVLEDVSEDIGFHKTSGGRGSAVFDTTGDGTLDVLIAGAHSGISLYVNNGDGTFRDASLGSGLDACVYAFALAPGDYDNDGLTDLFVTGLGFFDGQGRLLRNCGGGRFEDVTAEAGLDVWGPGFTASWIDYDGDGWLDLFVVNNLGGLFDRKVPNRLFRNNRDGTFSDVTREAGLTTPWPSLGHCWGDFHNDGLPDLFISNFGRAQLFKNRGDGTFEDISRQASLDLPAIGSVAMACDLDDDGWLDIVQCTYSRPGDAIYTLENGHGPAHGTPPRVFRNRGDGTFEDVARDVGIDGCWGTMSANFGDLGNRGTLDLVLGNGDPAMDRIEPTALYRRDAGGRFHDVTAAAGLPLFGKGHGVNMADLHGSGHLHLITSHGGLYPGDLMATKIHRPTGDLGHWLNLRLIATSGHHQALGARLELEAAGKRQHRMVSSGSSFGALPLEQHFGLGEATRVDKLNIRWPGGREQTLHDIPADRCVEIVEGDDRARDCPKASEA